MDHDRVEWAINRVRATRAAARCLEAGALPAAGAPVEFAVSVVAPGLTGNGGDHHWSYRVDREPGSVFPVGVTPVRFGGRIGSVGFRGRFHVVVGDAPVGGVPRPSLVTTGTGEGPRPTWLAQLPANVAVPCLPGPALRRAVVRLARGEGAATEEVLGLAHPLIDHLADGFAPQLRHRRSTIDRHDLVSEGWKRAYQLLDQFAGPERPNVTWATALYRNCRRDMARALHALDGVSEAVTTIRAASAAHPHITDPVALGRILAVQAAEREAARTRPSLDPAERRRLAERTAGPSRYSLSQIRWAMEVPHIVSWQDATGRHDGIGEDHDDNQLGDHAAGGEDPGLGAVEAPVGPVADALATMSDSVGPRPILHLLTDLGLATGGVAEAANLNAIRRRLLGPFILTGEAPQSAAVLARAGRRARRKLFVDGELLRGPALAAAWAAGISDGEARDVDRLGA